MVRPRSADDTEDEEDSAADDDSEEDDSPRPTRSRRAPPRRSPHGRPRPVRRWSSKAGGEDEPGDEEADGEERHSRWMRERVPVFWRARDSLYFGPLVALAIVIVLISSLYAFTQNWPPVYVVESGSMQHGTNDVVGLINAGDLVLAQKIPTQNIQTYVEGIRSGYSTYGEYGDVILYWPNGGGTTPIIHRAILYLQYDPQVNGFNATSLTGLPCGNASDAVYSVSPGSACATTGLTSSVVLTLYHIGWMSGTVALQLNPGVIGAESGFVTMGDNNTAGPGQLLPDQGEGAWLSHLVEPAWVLGVARGMLPWFGAFKLALEGRTAAVPAQSWEWLGLTISALILLALGIHFALRVEGIEDPRRLEEEEEEDDEGAGPPIGESRGRRILRSLRPWHSADEEGDDELAPPPRRPPSPKPFKPRRGRPHPHVRRPPKGKARKRVTGDEDEDL